MSVDVAGPFWHWSGSTRCLAMTLDAFHAAVWHIAKYGPPCTSYIVHDDVYVATVVSNMNNIIYTMLYKMQQIYYMAGDIDSVVKNSQLAIDPATETIAIRLLFRLYSADGDT